MRIRISRTVYLPLGLAVLAVFVIAVLFFLTGCTQRGESGSQPTIPPSSTPAERPSPEDTEAAGDETVKEAEPVTDDEEVITEPAGWKTYTNDEYGFEVKYPEGFVVETDVIPPASAAVQGATVKFRLIHEKYYRGKYYRGTNLEEASVVIGIRQGKGALEGCLKSEYTGERLTEEKKIDQVPFYRDWIHDAATGHRYSATQYRTIYENTCYEIALFVHSVGPDFFPPGTVSEFDSDAVMEELNQVLSTFRFTD